VELQSFKSINQAHITAFMNHRTNSSMKKSFIYFLLLPIITTIYIACSKNNDAPITDPRFPLPSIIKDSTSDEFISGKNPEDFLGKVVVSMYYGTEVVAQRVDVVVVRNGNKSNVKTLKAGVTSFPTTVEVTGTQLTALFDSTIGLGDVFEIAADVTAQDGRVYTGFPLTGNPYDADPATLPNSSFSVTYVANCFYDKNDYDGFYKVLTKTWDYEVGDLVEVRPGPDNTLLITAWPNPDVGNFTRIPMRVEVDPVTLVATVPMQVVGEFGGGQTHMIDEGTGTVSPCGDKITLSLVFMMDSYYGEQSLILGK